MVASVYKWLGIVGLGLFLSAATTKPAHPFHVSVTEINHNASAKTLEISCKIFTDDFEKVLEQQFKTKVDLIHPADKNKMDTLVKKYLLNRLSIQVEGRPVKMNYIGFENESEAAYGYFEVENVPVLTKAVITNSVLYDLYDDQISIIHMIENGNRKSTKLNYPDQQASFNF
jgi:uncharacterized protein DUF6702